MIATPHPIIRKAWRWWLWLKFLLMQRHRHNALGIERVAGKALIVLPEVFNPALFFSSDLLARALTIVALPPAARVLDLGTGSGVFAVMAAQRAGSVVAVDINPAAVRCARINVMLHQLEQRIDVREGDLFEPVAGERFDLITFNPPYYRGVPKDALDRAFRSPDVLERFAAGLDAVLAPDGRALLVLSTNSQAQALLDSLASHGFATRAMLHKHAISEILTIYEAVRQRGDRHDRAL